MLFTHEGQPVAPEHIVKHIWGEDSALGVGIVRTHIRHLRAKIAQLPGHPQPIRTMPGFGYTARQLDEEGKVASNQ